MFRRKTTIVVGAGASCELGLPSGEALKHRIAKLLTPSRDNAYGFADERLIALMKVELAGRVWDVGTKLGPIKEAAGRIRRGLPLALSIDNFLHAHQGDEQVERLGKLAVGICILDAEAGSHLFPDVPTSLRATGQVRDEPRPTLSNSKLAASWYPPFAQLLTSQIQRHEIGRAFENLRFVVFNYDRCLEQYLWMAIQDYF